MRAFIALEVPEEIKQRAEELEKEFALDGITLVRRNVMHITLQFLGEVSVQELEKTTAVMKGIEHAPFDVELAGVSFFTPRLIRVIFIKLARGEKELQEIYGKLSGALAAMGIRFEEEAYTPHFTIARVKRVRDMRRLREVLEKNSGVSLGSFEARTITLKESVLTQEGPVYRSLYEREL